MMRGTKIIAYVAGVYAVHVYYSLIALGGGENTIYDPVLSLGTFY